MMTALDIGSPAVALAALAEFALLAADQATHESSVMANFVDGNVHDLVLATTPLEVREDVFAHLVSDPIPEAACVVTVRRIRDVPLPGQNTKQRG